jgi:predicted esterase
MLGGVSKSCVYLHLGALLVGTACTVDDVGGTAEGDGGGSSTAAADTTGGGTPGSAEGVTSQSSADTTAGPVSEDGPIIDDFGSASDLPPVITGDCRDEPPPGAMLPPPLPVYGGVCPELVPGLNTIDSSGNPREFLFIVPTDLDPEENVPVIFLWHWLGGDAQAFLEDGDVQNAVNQFRFVAVIPSSKGDSPFQWPYTILDSDARQAEEFQFFDDMLACVAEQNNVAEGCIASAGVSAGALFTGQLASGRGERFSSILSLSGGTGGAVIKPWSGSSHKMPAMVLWGGPMDFCVAVDFNVTSMDLENNLQKEGHFVLECIHDCTHAAPPFEVAQGETAFAPLWKFVLSHPYWLQDGESPYNATGVPDDMPDWCGIGVGGCTPRMGECGGSQC